MPGGRATIKYRVSPNVVCHWRQGRLYAVNFATRYQVSVNRLVMAVLTDLGDWRTVAEVGHSLGTAPTRELHQLLARLLEATILQSSRSALVPRDRAMERWEAWNPSVGLFHGMSSGVSFLENDPPRKGRARVRPIEGRLVHKSGHTIRLARPEITSDFDRTVLERRTWRRFSDEDLPRTAVEHLLWLTAGVQGWLKAPRGEMLPLTTSPSGGSRHPIEVYAFVKHVRGLSAGLYRYDGVAHTLRTIGPPPARTRDYLPRQYWFENAPLIIFLCAQFGRTMERYPFPRAYRAVLLEAGHVCQTFCLAATALGLAPFCTMALDDHRIEADLGLDGVEMAVLYAAGVGVRSRRGTPAAPLGERDIAITPASIKEHHGRRRSPRR